MSLNDYLGAIECCRRYGGAEPKLWILMFNSAMVDEMFPPSMLEEILNEIGMYQSIIINSYLLLWLVKC